ncbi:MAG: calcium/sodium antiporter [Thermodesulfobacteriota bacterium]
MFSTDSFFIEAIFLATGIAGVWVGADSAVAGASLLARKLKVNPVIAGLTVIAVGTSLPEIFVCLTAAFKGSADIATGNIVGSNISNIGLIAGISAVLAPISVRQGLRAETAAAIAGLGLLLFLCADGTLGRAEGFYVIAAVAPLTAYLYVRQAGKTGEEIPEEIASGAGAVLVTIAAGLAALGLGSSLLVESAVSIAHRAEVPEVVIGATAVAVGTSLPELAASVAAVSRREHSIAVGNIAGSNLFNIIILGLTSSIVPLSVDSEVPGFQLPVAIGLTALTLPFMKKGATAGRTAGAVLLLIYGAFLYRVFAGS